MTPNWFGILVFCAWPLVAMYLYTHRTTSEATVWTLLAALLILPAGAAIKFQMIPSIDKNSLPNLCVFAGCMLTAGRISHRRFQFSLCEILLITFIISPLISSLLNNDPIIVGGSILPGVGTYDGISSVISQLILSLSFIVGRRYLRDPGDNAVMLRALIIAGLAYSLPMLFEIRMSPQLSSALYGYLPTAFLTEIRYGGFRPVVFMGNGLIVAFFMMTCVVASVTYLRARARVIRFAAPSALTLYLGTILVLCKTAAPISFAAVLGALVRFARPEVQIRLAMLFACLALSYPTLRAIDVFPTKALVDFARSIDSERAQSLEVRFDQEAALLAHASERFYFGWGRYGRNRVFTEDSGKDDSITDGLWIITMGQFGFVGFLAQFGLLTLPIFRAFHALKFVQNQREKIFFGAISLILAISAVDQLPNASLSSWTWLIAGSLLGQSEALRAKSKGEFFKHERAKVARPHSFRPISYKLP
jgi:hypothetical protein